MPLYINHMSEIHSSACSSGTDNRKQMGIYEINISQVLEKQCEFYHLEYTFTWNAPLSLSSLATHHKHNTAGVKNLFPYFRRKYKVICNPPLFLATHGKHATLCGQKSVAGKLSVFTNCDAHFVLSILFKWSSNWIKSITQDHIVG